MQNDNQNDSVFWGFVIDAAIVLAALALYSKTQEVMTAIAPATLFGQKGLSLIYGFGVAALIEGVTLALHFLKRFEGNNRAEGYKWFLFGISTFCQFLDKSILKDAASQSQMESFFNWIAYGIVPAIFFGLLWVKGGFVQPKTRQSHKGVIPAFKEVLWGTQENSEFSTKTKEPLEKIPEPAKPKPNGEKSDTANPTIAGRR